jgi:antitoxin ParD1/3/4
MVDASKDFPRDLKRWIDRRVADGAYIDEADYLRDLVRRDLAQTSEIERVQALIDDGFASGIVEGEPEDLLREVIARIPVPHG